MLTLDTRQGPLADILPILKAQKQIAYAMQLSMNDFLFETNKILRKEIDYHLQGGAEAFTRSGFRVHRVKNKRNLHGGIYASLASGKKPYNDREYLRNIVDGGIVKPPRPDRKKLMQPLPGRVPVNKRGNLTKGKYVSLRKKKNYFYGIPKFGPQTENRRGLWRTKRGGKKIEMVIALGKTERPQAKLFPYEKIIKRRFDLRFKNIFRERYQYAVESADKRRSNIFHGAEKRIRNP